MGIVKNAEGEKVGKKSKEVENNYVNNTKILPHFFIQKRSVEKVVENVERVSCFRIFSITVPE